MSEIIDATRLAPLYVTVQPAWTMGVGADKQHLVTVFYDSREHHDACRHNDGMLIVDRVNKGLPRPIAWTEKRLTRAYKRYTLNCAVYRLEWL